MEKDDVNAKQYQQLELAKDIAAMANSGGGTFVYGIAEISASGTSAADTIVPVGLVDETSARDSRGVAGNLECDHSSAWSAQSLLKAPETGQQRDLGACAAHSPRSAARHFTYCCVFLLDRITHKILRVIPTRLSCLLGRVRLSTSECFPRWTEAINVTRPKTAMQALVVIEDDPDIQWLVETLFAIDPRFYRADVADSAEAALEWSARTAKPGVIVLDHGLTGPLTGLAAAPRIKAAAPLTKIIMFTAHAELLALADDEPAVDAFLLKTHASRLLPLAQQLTGLGALHAG